MVINERNPNSKETSSSDDLQQSSHLVPVICSSLFFLIAFITLSQDINIPHLNESVKIDYTLDLLNL